MTQPVLIKAYGNLYPADSALRNQINRQCRDCASAGDPPASLDGELLRISFEGIWFPAEEVLELIKNQLSPDQSGKLDILDLENWRLDRSVFEKGEIFTHSAPLNNVLDYSGH